MLQKKRIGVIGLKGLPAFGGAATVGENIIECLKENYDFTVYSTASHTERKGDMGGYKQIVFRKLPWKKANVFFYYLVSAMHAVFRGKYDLIHLHHIDGAFILFILRLRYKVISTSHARTFTRDKWNAFEKLFFRINERIFLGLSSTITVVSRMLREAYMKISNKEINYIPNGTKLDTGFVSEKDIPEDDYIMFAAGRIIAIKGCHLMLEALNRIKYQGKILIVGDLNQLPRYRKQIENLSAGLNVVFIDLIREKELLLGYVRKARLFIFPSLKEDMSIMLLEAATMHTPVVCSDIEENRAVFEPDEVLFFSSGSVDSLTEKISFALDHPDEMSQRAAKAYKKLEGQFEWGRISQMYKKLYDSLMNPA